MYLIYISTDTDGIFALPFTVMRQIKSQATSKRLYQIIPVFPRDFSHEHVYTFYNTIFVSLFLAQRHSFSEPEYSQMTNPIAYL